MTPRARRSLFIIGLIFAITLPVESVLLKAIATPSQQVAAQQYVASLTPAQLSTAANSIESFPFAYRRPIMAALSASAQADVWHTHLKWYASTRTLSASALAVLQQASELVTPQAVASPDPATKSMAEALGNQLIALVGADEAHIAMAWLGTKDGRVASALPITQRVADFIRRTVVVAAAGASDCDCHYDSDCSGTCNGSSGCSTTWMGCGWFWFQECTGTCRPGAVAH